MKKLLLLNAALCSFLIFGLYGCSKDTSSSTALTTSASNNITAGDTTTLVLQPGPGEGEDTYVQQFQYHHGNAKAVYGSVPELSAVVWTDGGQVIRNRIYIKFTGINNIPATANIISATLSLYGLYPGTSSLTPQGCSIYPGSPYDIYPDNSCAIVRVIGNDWSQDTLDWQNKPMYGGKSISYIPSSTSQWAYDTSADVTRLVRQIVTDQKNYGFCIRLTNESIYRSMIFASSESTDPSKRPKLVVKYTM